jgi:hypothetical protein
MTRKPLTEAQLVALERDPVTWTFRGDEVLLENIPIDVIVSEIRRLRKIEAAAREAWSKCLYDRDWCINHSESRPCSMEVLEAALGAGA